MDDAYSDMEESIQEYSSEKHVGKVNWIVNKGLTVGKKILVTGFVISSAPVVLPPLVVISLIGFACSVPYGVLFASYACTDKLMSKLLPESKPPPFLLEYGKLLSTDEGFENGEGEDMEFKGGIDLEKGEEEMLEDIRETVEMRIELVEEGNDEVDEERHGRVGKDAPELVKDSNEIAEENGYEEDVGEYEVDKEVEPTKLGVEVRIDAVGEEEEEEKEPVMEQSWDQLPIDEVQAIVVGFEGDEIDGGISQNLVAPFEVTNIDLELCQNTGIKEDEELVKETRGCLEKIREEGMTDNGEKNKQSAEELSGSAEEEHQKVNGNIKEVGMPFEDRIVNTRMEKLLGEVKTNNDGIPKESSRVQERRSVQNADVIPKEINSKKMVGGSLAKKDTDNISDAGKPITTRVGGNVEDEQKPVVNKASTLQGGVASDNIAKNVEKEIQLNREKENLISSNADAREIADESGFDLFDNKDAAPHQYSYVDNDTVESKGNEQSSTYVSPDVDFTALPVFGGEHKHNEGGIRSQEDIGRASSKALYSDEKIWEQIDAMRRIVGYKAAPQATCIEELKALYLFTGVVPPALFKDPSDLADVNNKLRFLMSIVGVK